MSRNKSEDELNPKLVRAVDELLALDDLILDDRLAVIDRAMKLEALKLKRRDEAEGSAFDTGVSDD